MTDSVSERLPGAPGDRLAWSLLVQYVEGTASATDVTRVEAFLARHPRARAVVAAYVRGAGGASLEVRAADVAASWRALQERCEVSLEAVPRRAPMSLTAGARTRWWRAGAAAVVAGAISLVVGRATRAPGIGAAPPRVYTTAAGQRAIVVLPDGSRVTLAPASRLTVEQDYGVVHRALSLSGEAYFDVAAAAGAPFDVRTGGVHTRVLGTTFFVRRFPGDAAARVIVTSGKVAVGGAGARPPVTLVAGRAGVVDDSGDARVVAAPGGGDDAGWLNGRLVFRDAPAANVLATIGRWYGYEFRLADTTLASRTLTMALSTRSAARALSTLKLLLDVEMAFDGNVVTLTPRRGDAIPRRTRGGADELTDHRSEAGR